MSLRRFFLENLLVVHRKSKASFDAAVPSGTCIQREGRIFQITASWKGGVRALEGTRNNETEGSCQAFNH